MKLSIFIILNTCLISVFGATTHVHGADEGKSTGFSMETENWLPQGRFEINPEGMPTDWQVEEWVRSYISLKGEAADPYLRFDAQHGKGNDKTILAEIPVDGAQAVFVSFLARGRDIETGTEAWQTAAVELDFRSNGKKLGQMRLHLTENTSDWEVHQRVDQIPAGTDTIRVRLGFWRSQGIFDIKDLSVYGLTFPKPHIPEAPEFEVKTDVWSGDFNGLPPENGWGWEENPGVNASERAPTHRVEQTEEGSVFTVGIPSYAKLVLSRSVPVERGLVYRVTFTARCVGQVEQVYVSRFMDHKQRFRWPLEREWSTYSVQAMAKQNGRMDFQVELTGVGEFQIRDFAITAHADFELEAVDAPFRGELLPNGDFALGPLDWTLRYRNTDDSPVSPFSPEDHMNQSLRQDKNTGQMKLELPAQHSILYSGTLMTAYFGRQYEISVTGESAAGNLDLFLVRPGQSTHDNEMFPLTFRDGVARAVFNNRPGDRMVAEPQENFALQLRHRGSAPAVIGSVSIREVGPGAPTKTSTRFGVQWFWGDGNRSRVAPYGESVVVRVRSAGVTEKSGKFSLVIYNELEEPVRKIPMPEATPRQKTFDVQVGALPLGWYRATVEGDHLKTAAVVTDDLAVIIPAERGTPSNGFLGMHPTEFSFKDQINSLARMGFRRARLYYGFEWFRLQPEPKGPLAVPLEQLDILEEAGIEPMVVLFGTPEWASSMPPGTTGWQRWKKYPPTDMGQWESYVRVLTAQLGNRVQWYEIWNEPNDHFLHRAPSDKRTLEAIYAELVNIAGPIIRKQVPKANIVVGATAGSPWFVVKTLREHPELLEWTDAISYHAYESGYLANMGAKGFSHRPLRQSWLQEYLKEIGQPEMPIIDSEAGIHQTFDGPAGRYVAMLTAKGIVSRQAAGFSQFYLFRADSRDYPGQINIYNVFGFNGRPLVNVPVFAAWTHFLGAATFVKNLGDDNEGRHHYLFHRPDGVPVIAAWNSDPKASTTIHMEGTPSLLIYDYLGRQVGETEGAHPEATADLRYYVPIEGLGSAPQPGI
jgi:hypothetical protein